MLVLLLLLLLLLLQRDLRKMVDVRSDCVIVCIVSFA